MAINNSGETDLNIIARSKGIQPAEAKSKGKTRKGDQPSDDSGFFLTIDLIDNNLAKSLFGQYDEHLVILEKMLDIEAVSRGNELHLSGSREALQAAELALTHIYERLTKDETIEKGDIIGALKLAMDNLSGKDLQNKKLAKENISPEKKSRSKKQNQNKVSAEKPASSKPAKLNPATISTNKRTIQARTRNQSR